LDGFHPDFHAILKYSIEGHFVILRLFLKMKNGGFIEKHYVGQRRASFFKPQLPDSKMKSSSKIDPSRKRPNPQNMRHFRPPKHRKMAFLTPPETLF
jgi:hypothetical protein